MIIIKPPESHEAYQIMEDFANSLPPGRMNNILSEAISKKKPFRNAIIHHDQWSNLK